MPKPTQKLYCYVDETGQDTKGELFLVSIVITEDDYEALEKLLDEIERKSQKRKDKWSGSSIKRRLAYLELIINNRQFRDKISYAHYHSTKEYQELTILATA